MTDMSTSSSLREQASAPRYDTLSITLHWLTALLVIALFTSALVWGEIAKGTPLRKELQALHISMGICLAAIVLGRIVWRCTGGQRLGRLQPGLAGLLATLGHLALYALLLIQISLGFLFRWAQGEPFEFFGLFPIPAPIAIDHGMRGTYAGWHEKIAWTLIILAGLHAVVALLHHYVLRDSTLTRMLPGRRRAEVPKL